MQGTAKLPEATVRRVEGVNCLMMKLSGSGYNLTTFSINIHLVKEKNNEKYMTCRHWYCVCS